MKDDDEIVEQRFLILLYIKNKEIKVLNFISVLAMASNWSVLYIQPNNWVCSAWAAGEIASFKLINIHISKNKQGK